MEGGGPLKKTWIYLEGPSITLKADKSDLSACDATLSRPVAIHGVRSMAK